MTDLMVEPSVHIDRSKYIGGSDAAAILGLSPWKTARDVYLEKTGQAEDRPISYRMMKGTASEPVISDWYREQTGYRIIEPDFIGHPEKDFLGGHPDRFAEVDGKIRILEIKDTTRANDYGRPGTDQIPDWVIAQVNHYAMLARAQGMNLDSVAEVIADRGRGEPDIFKMPIVTEHLAYHEKEMESFYKDYLLAGSEPDPQNQAECLARWPGISGEVATASEEDLDLLKVRAELASQIKRLGLKLEDVDLQLKRKMGDAVALMHEGKKIISWNIVKKPGRFDTKSLKEKMPEIYETFFRKGEGSTRRWIPKELG